MSRDSTIRPLDDDRELQAEYQAAFEEWRKSEDAALWDSTAGDGLPL